MIVNEIYLRTLAKGNTMFNNSDKEFLDWVSQLCPLETGPVVYRARSMYALFDELRQYDDSSFCAALGHYRNDVAQNNSPARLSPRGAGLQVFPNPSDGLVKFRANNGFDEGVLSVFNAHGEEVHHQHAKGNESEIQLDARAFPRGMYLVRYCVDGKCYSQKFILK
jgi:hypothetical protein